MLEMIMYLNERRILIERRLIYLMMVVGGLVLGELFSFLFRMFATPG